MTHVEFVVIWKVTKVKYIKIIKTVISTHLFEEIFKTI